MLFFTILEPIPGHKKQDIKSSSALDWGGAIDPGADFLAPGIMFAIEVLGEFWTTSWVSSESVFNPSDIVGIRPVKIGSGSARVNVIGLSFHLWIWLTFMIDILPIFPRGNWENSRLSPFRIIMGCWLGWTWMVCPVWSMKTTAGSTGLATGRGSGIW